MNANDNERTCAKCFFATQDMIPDRTFVWGVDGKAPKAKPKVQGFRCHVNKPTSNGFPAMVESDFCPFYTDRETMKQPLRHLTECTIMTNATAATREG